MKRGRAAFVRLALAVLPAAIAAPAAAGEELAFADRDVVTDDRLAQMRGGYSLGSGKDALELSFGIERTVSIDGVVVGASTLKVASVANIDALRQRTDGVVQSGVGNELNAMLASNALSAFAVIQNTRDNRILQQSTIIDLDVRNLDLFRASRLGATLSRQLFMSTR